MALEKNISSPEQKETQESPVAKLDAGITKAQQDSLRFDNMEGDLRDIVNAALEDKESETASVRQQTRSALSELSEQAGNNAN